MNKKKFIISLIISFLLGGLFFRYSSAFFFDAINFVEDQGILGNIIDFLGNIFIAITSAMIAYFVSSYQTNKSEKEFNEKRLQESNMYLKLLAMEISTHKIMLQSILNSEGKDFEQIKKDLEKMSTFIWNGAIEKINVDNEDLARIYKYYMSLFYLKNISVEDIIIKDMLLIRNHLSKSEKAVEYINSLID